LICDYFSGMQVGCPVNGQLKETATVDRFSVHGLEMSDAKSVKDMKPSLK
jgi:hypothetical protein